LVAACLAHLQGRDHDAKSAIDLGRHVKMPVPSGNNDLSELKTAHRGQYYLPIIAVTSVIVTALRSLDAPVVVREQAHREPRRAGRAARLYAPRKALAPGSGPAR
jgi:hypothetical protein